PLRRSGPGAGSAPGTTGGRGRLRPPPGRAAGGGGPLRRPLLPSEPPPQPLQEALPPPQALPVIRGVGVVDLGVEVRERHLDELPELARLLGRQGQLHGAPPLTAKTDTPQDRPPPQDGPRRPMRVRPRSVGPGCTWVGPGCTRVGEGPAFAPWERLARAVSSGCTRSAPRRPGTRP